MKTIVEMTRWVISTSLLQRWATAATPPRNPLKRNEDHRRDDPLGRLYIVAATIAMTPPRREENQQASRDFSLLACALETRDRH
jgi:hypothetical protein